MAAPHHRTRRRPLALGSGAAWQQRRQAVQWRAQGLQGSVRRWTEHIEHMHLFAGFVTHRRVTSRGRSVPVCSPGAKRPPPRAHRALSTPHWACAALDLGYAQRASKQRAIPALPPRPQLSCGSARWAEHCKHCCCC